MISMLPTNREYYVGEDPDFSGLEIGIIKPKGKTEFIKYTTDNSSITITGFDSSTPTEDQRITVTYEGYTAYFSVKIKEIPKPAPVLKSISLETLPKTEYKLGERLDTTGGVILCEYKDGTITRVNLTNGDVSGYSRIDAPGTYELTVKYKKNGIIATTTYTITVTE